MRFYVCRTSCQDETESVKDLVLYSCDNIHGCWLYIASSILSQGSYDAERLKYIIEYYEIYTDGLTESPLFNSSAYKMKAVSEILSK